MPLTPRSLLLCSGLFAGTVLAGLGAAAPAAAQPMLYAQRLPDGFAFVRVASALPAGATVKPDFGDAVTLGEGGADRVSPYFVAEDVANRPVKFEVTAGGRTSQVQVTVTGGGLNTVLLRPEGEGVAAVSINDQGEYNQTRSRLTFYNAVPGCGGGALALDPSGQSVFSGLESGSGRTRSLNPAQATVRASCDGKRTPALDLGRLQPGGLYSVFLMSPTGQPVAFIVQDRIAPR